ncbi:PRD domain-containing protein [Anaerorhabdus sp.]|uniref:PRD domain-containing protein n=1 Tax=Anaerorhabdus sp. TaxID=1872524 RepID=UPI002FCBEC5F
MEQYKVIKILSNNAIIALDKNKQEIIALGSGIGFGKKPGSLVTDNQIEKIFENTQEDFYRKLFTTLNKDSSNYVSIVDRAVRYAKEDLNQDLNEYIYVMLTDHLLFAVERMNQNILLPCPMLSEIRYLYKKEFAVAKKVVDDIKQTMQIELPESEVGFIALHIMNASTSGSNVNGLLDSLGIVNEIVEIVEKFFDIKFDLDSIHYSRLIVHLNFFAKRVIFKNESLDEEVSDLFEGKYPKQKACLEKIKEYLKEEYNYEISKTEMMYLLIHITRCTSRTL